MNNKLEFISTGKPSKNVVSEDVRFKHNYSEDEIKQAITYAYVTIYLYMNRNKIGYGMNITEHINDVNNIILQYLIHKGNITSFDGNSTDIFISNKDCKDCFHNLEHIPQSSVSKQCQMRPILYTTDTHKCLSRRIVNAESI